ncbi:MAG: hypothetical protein Q4P84_08165 [Elusimicrobiales bacterium]|nr:hypothetical protein [Elusimicrobiales bacterium]
MRQEYEQLELDTRKQLDKAISIVTEDAVATAGEMIQRNYEEMVRGGSLTPGFVRNRHEAYGIAAEQLTRISRAIKAIKDDVGTLLGTLPDPNLPAIEATSSICNSTLEAATILVKAAAEMKRTLENLYLAETTGSSEPTPMEQLAGASFQEVGPVEAEEYPDGEDTED